MSNKGLIGAVSTLIGFIIGAGILGIPYVVAKSGFIIGLIDIIIIGLAFLIINLYLGEVILRTKGLHQLTGYAEKYLGKIGKGFMIFSMVFGMYGALVAYILKEGEFLFAILKDIFGGTPFIYSLLFFFFASYLIFKDIKLVEKYETCLVSLLLIIIAVIFFISFKRIDYTNLQHFYPSRFFIPFGVILFAFFSTAALPELGEELKNNKKLMKKAIIIGSIIPIIIYIVFTLIIIGVTGINTTDGAIIGLGNVLGYNALLLGTIFGILTMATSFIAVGLALKEMYNFDFKLSRRKSATITCLIPLIFVIVLLNLKIRNPFFRVLDITGIFAGGIAIILTILMSWKAKKLGERKPEYSIHENKWVGSLLIIMFLAGMLLELLIITGIITI